MSQVRSHLKGAWGIGSSPPRRVTRGQSREAHNTFDEHRDTLHGEGLDATPGELVISYKSPKKLGKPRQAASRQSLDWQDDPLNISGTTIFPLDSEPDTDLDPILMIETLPDLERSARDFLNFLIRREPDPVRIVNTAGQLNDPQSTQGVRFRRKRSNLLSEVKYFGSQAYIDISLVNPLILRVLQDRTATGVEAWRPDPILHRANCARLALEVLAGGLGSPPRAIINELENIFPEAFIGSQLDTYQEKAALDLALEIRTQYLVAELEGHQHNDDFDPLATMDAIFYNEAVPDEAGSDVVDQRPLRGFGHGVFENRDGSLPERFKGAVCDRINDIRIALADDEDESPNISALRGAYRWRGFKLRVVEWIRGRDDAITLELNEQRDTEEMALELLNESQFVSSHGGVAGSPFSGRESVERTRTPIVSTRQLSAGSTLTPLKGSAEQVKISTAMDGQTSTSVAGITEGRRKSGKPVFLNASSMRNMRERLDLERQRLNSAGLQDATNPTGVSMLSPTAIASQDASEATESRRRTIAALETRCSTEQEIPVASQGLTTRTHRRQTIPLLRQREGFLLERAHLTAPRASQAQDRYRQSFIHSPVAQQDDVSGSPIMPVSPEASTMPLTGSYEPLLSETPLELDDARPRVGDRSAPVAFGAATPGQNGQIGSLEPKTSAERFRTPSADSIWRAAKQVKNIGLHPGSSNIAPKATPVDARRRPAFIDRQQDAHRVSPISQDDVRSFKSRRFYPGTKRSRDVFEDVDEDDEFTQDNRVIDIVNRRAQKPSQSPSKRQRMEQDARQGQVPGRFADPFNLSPQPNRRQDYHVQPENRNTPTPERPQELLRMDSPQKFRRRWTEEEDKVLIQYIARYGCQWAKIKAVDDSHSQASGGNKLKDRNQRQLKDRARSLKLKFYREGQLLPENFDKVTPVGRVYEIS